jgi:hypothetical protein
MAEGAAKECIGAADLLDSRTRLNPQTVQLAPLINEVIGTAGQLAEQNKSRPVVDAQENLGAYAERRNIRLRDEDYQCLRESGIVVGPHILPGAVE